MNCPRPHCGAALRSHADQKRHNRIRHEEENDMNKTHYCHQDRIALDRVGASLHMGAGHEVEAVDVMLEPKRDNFIEDNFPLLEMAMTERFEMGLKA